jgi:hypothetical protein
MRFNRNPEVAGLFEHNFADSEATVIFLNLITVFFVSGKALKS